MAADDLSARLRATFLQELEDQLREMNACLLQLEQEPENAELVRTLFRSAHSVKGAARVAGVPMVEQACHALETVYAQIRDGSRALDEGIVGLLFAAIDVLGDAHRRLQAGEALEAAPLAALLPKLQEAASSGTTSAAPTAAPPQDKAEQPAAAPPREDARAARDEPAPQPRHEATETVRVPAERLDRLAAVAADLLTTAGAVAARPEQLEDLRADIAHWAVAWRRESRTLLTEQERARRAELDRRLHELVERTAQLTRMVQDESRVLVRATDDVLNGVRGLRMRRFADAAEGLPRAVRDVAAETGKQVELVIEGEEVEADRIVIDAVREPLLHLVRNAVDHGIEPVDERRARGKPERGRVRVAALIEHGRLQILVEDDGGGIDADAVRRQIAAAGGEIPRDSRALARRLLAGGVTTKLEATSISGRAVGLDLVRAALERIGGAVELRWKRGEYTRVLLDAPPSPTTLRAVIAEAGGQLFALPVGQVERVVRVESARVREVDGRPALLAGGSPLPLATLAGVLGPPLRDRGELAGAQALLLRSGDDGLALVVDAVVDEREFVVRPLDPRAHVPHVSGGALLPTGRVALVLVARTILQAGIGRDVALPRIAAEDAGAPVRHLLVADDSITTRTLEQSVLEAAGYRVTPAVDGLDAWEKIQRGDVDLVVSDVEMPRMSGFDLCRRLRESKRFAEVPVVLVTGMETPEDRALGLEVGADAYLLKSSFDQATLLDTIRQLID